MIKRVRVIIKGIVQGVGFRPFIYRLANECSLTGSINNDLQGVEIEVQGLYDNIEAFLMQVKAQAPPVSRIKSMETRSMDTVPDEKSFSIKTSIITGNQAPEICPDISICEKCIDEMTDINNRRHEYPFINCTDCGPRYSIINSLPYDRPNTSMAFFEMCSKCKAEYNSHDNRRFHAQPVSCYDCGPVLYSPTDRKQKDIISYAISLLKSGKIIAVKGIGGFHLACDACSDEPVKRLRESKARGEKPFAVMVPDIKYAEKFAYLDKGSKEILLSNASPAVILQKKPDSPLSEYISPNINTYGILLPYTPLHYLLFHYNGPDKPHFKALVMTSANISSKPLIKDEKEFKKLNDSNIYDIISHNREIVNRIDDSVVGRCRNGLIFYRRSRGYAPFSMKLPSSNRQTLCLGAEMKNTIALTADDTCHISPYIGDLKDVDTFLYMLETMKKLKGIYRIRPERISCDKHPLYENTKWARKEAYDRIEIQHHHAHIASVAGEKQYFSDTIGVAFDGSGYGDDGNIWGGEFFLGNPLRYIRAGHLNYTKLQGGRTVPKQPFRTAISYLYQVYGKDFSDIDIPVLKTIDHETIRLITDGLAKDINTFQSSSLGRLFDTVSAISGLRLINSYEGQAAIELEASLSSTYAAYSEKGIYPYDINLVNDVYIIDTKPVIKAVIYDTESKAKISTISLKFHNTIADIILSVCRLLREKTGIRTVMLSGGVFQNRYLRELSDKLLSNSSFDPYFNNMVSPGDEGISYGQAVISSLL